LRVFLMKKNNFKEKGTGLSTKKIRQGEKG